MIRRTANRSALAPRRPDPKVLLLVVALAGPARADGPGPGRPGPCHDLAFRRPVDLPVTVLTLGAALGTELAIDHLAPGNCRWCDGDAGPGDRLNRFDASARRRLRWDRPGRARTLSNAALIGTAAWSIGAFAAAGGRDEFRSDVGLMAEAAGVTGVVTQVTKLAMARQRPYAHFRSGATTGSGGSDPSAGDNLSFFSGHTAGAFAMAVAAGRIASLRGRPHRAWTWGVGLSLAALTGYFRVAGDEHYATDVLTGAVVGSVVGWIVPALHRSCPGDMPADEGWQLLPAGDSAAGAILRFDVRW